MRYCLAAAAALALSASAAQADTIVALSGDGTLSMIDAKAGKVTGSAKISGIGPVLGIDVRPADGMLYALASDGTVATLDAKTGKATAKSKLDTLPPSGAKVTVDFNPVADRMRIIGSDGTNLRANVDDGKVTKDQPLKFAGTDAAKDKTPSIVAGGYTNSMKGAKETTLYDIDGKLGGLLRQAPPNDGILNTIGMLGVDAKAASFDIMTDGAGANTAMLLAGKKLYSVDLASGKAAAAKEIAGLKGQVSDIAVLPKM
jgi:DNA-binding beta-propeller fold protein YncE